MQNIDFKNAEKTATASEGIHYYIHKIQELLRLSSDENSGKVYLNQIVEKIRRVKILGTVKGDQHIEHLAFRTSFTLQNIFKYSETVRQECSAEIRYFLTALKSIALPGDTETEFIFTEQEIHDPEFDTILTDLLDDSQETASRKDEKFSENFFHEIEINISENEASQIQADSTIDSQDSGDEALLSNSNQTDISGEKKSESLHGKEEDEETATYLAQITEQIQEIKKLGITRGDEYIVKLAVNTTIALQNILKYGRFDNEEIDAEYQYFLTALKNLSISHEPISESGEIQEDNEEEAFLKDSHAEHVLSDEAIPDDHLSEPDENYERLSTDSDLPEQSETRDDENDFDDLLTEHEEDDEDSESGWFENILDEEMKQDENSPESDALFQEVQEFLNDNEGEIQSDESFEELEINSEDDNGFSFIDDAEEGLEEILKENIRNIEVDEAFDIEEIEDEVKNDFEILDPASEQEDAISDADDQLDDPVELAESDEPSIDELEENDDKQSLSDDDNEQDKDTLAEVEKNVDESSEKSDNAVSTEELKDTERPDESEPEHEMPAIPGDSEQQIETETAAELEAPGGNHSEEKTYVESDSVDSETEVDTDEQSWDGHEKDEEESGSAEVESESNTAIENEVVSQELIPPEALEKIEAEVDNEQGTESEEEPATLEVDSPPEKAENDDIVQSSDFQKSEVEINAELSSQDAPEESEIDAELTELNQSRESQDEQADIAENVKTDTESIKDENENQSENENAYSIIESETASEENVRSLSVGTDRQDDVHTNTKPGVGVAVAEEIKEDADVDQSTIAETDARSDSAGEETAAEQFDREVEKDTAEDSAFSFDENLKSDNAAIGLDISSSSIKVVVLKKDEQGLKLVHWRIYDLDINESEEERIKNIKHVWTDFLSRYKQLKKLPVVTSLIDNSVLIRYITLPNMSDANFMRSAALEFQAELFFPEDQVKIITYPYHVQESKNGKQKTGLLLAIENHILDQILTLIKNASIKISRVCIDSFALAQYFDDKDETVRAIIDLGADIVKIVIIHKREIRFARNIESYEKSVTAEIAEYMGVDLNEAENLKHQIRFVAIEDDRKKFSLNLPEGTEGNIQNVAFPLYSKLSDEIQLTLQYYNSNNDKKVERVDLVGGGALLKGFDKFLSHTLKLLVNVADINNRLTVPNIHHRSSMLGRISPKLVVATGLALSQIAPMQLLTKIDLRKKHKIKKEKISFGYAKLLIPVAALVLFTLGVQIFFKFQTSKYEKNMDGKKKIAAEMALTIESLKEYEELKGKLDAQIQNIRSLKLQQPRWSRVMKILSQKIPDGIWLDQFIGKYETVIPEEEEEEMSFGDEESPDSEEEIDKNQYFLNLSLKGATTEQYRIQEFISRVEKDDSYEPIHFSKIINQEIPKSNITKFDADGKADISGNKK